MQITTKKNFSKVEVVRQQDFRRNTLYRDINSGILFWSVDKTFSVKLETIPTIVQNTYLCGNFERVEEGFEVTLEQE